ncbi:MAG: transketolase family protein [Candidatus Accumulibacter sp.]|jgi:transketolase|nr:transketolase family protein [Accumulibacter sp.]
MKKGDMIAQRNAFGQALLAIADRYPDMLVFDPDVCASTQTAGFRKAHPGRFYEMGIAEANAVCVAAGMAACGFTPWVSAFAVFLAKRALDQIRVSVAHARLPVKLNGAYGGLPSGRGGATHSSVEDIAVMRAMPNMTIFCPADAVETIAMTDLAMRTPGPVYLRTVRCETPVIFDEGWKPVVGKAAKLADGNDIAICSEGMMTAKALAAAEKLARLGIKARILHFSTIKPFDTEAVVDASRECGRILTVENHSRIGGLGGAVCEALAEQAPCLVRRAGFPDVFMESGDDEAIFAGFGMDADGLARQAREMLAAPSLC